MANGTVRSHAVVAVAAGRPAAPRRQASRPASVLTRCRPRPNALSAQIPTALPIARRDYPDVVFRNRVGANAAMLTEVERLHKDGRPVLIGTTNVQMSEQTAKELEERGVPCQVRFDFRCFVVLVFRFVFVFFFSFFLCVGFGFGFVWFRFGLVSSIKQPSKWEKNKCGCGSCCGVGGVRRGHSR